MNKNNIEPYILDDRVIIPEYIEKMSKKELNDEIKRLEEKQKLKKAKINMAG